MSALGQWKSKIQSRLSHAWNGTGYEHYTGQPTIPIGGKSPTARSAKQQ